MEHKIIKVLPDSIAEELEIEAGDVLLSVNGEEVEDIFDYQSMIEEEYVRILLRHGDEEWELEIEKDPYEDLGLVFESSLMSDYRGCTNQCIFCFIDQMPKGMRPTLYFKDDDSRLSFLQGNYITLTNMKEKDIQRIIRYHMEPMNISVHTTDPELRVKMLHNRFAGEVLKYLDEFYEAGLHMNGQIVLCKDINDGENLKKTLQDLYRYAPVMESVSVVPVGLTKYREGLYPLQPVDKKCAEDTIDIIEKFQKKAYDETGLHFVHASDEFYILAEREFPEEERYDGYLQLENGVGMARLQLDEAKERIKEHLKAGKKPEGPGITCGTGVLAAPLLEHISDLVMKAFPERKGKVDIIPIINDFFGHQVTVAGLVTGQDLINQLKDRELKEYLALPNVMFRSGEEVFLDDISKTDVEQALNRPVYITNCSGTALVDLMLGDLTEDQDPVHGEYELPDTSYDEEPLQDE